MSQVEITDFEKRVIFEAFQAYKDDVHRGPKSGNPDWPNVENAMNSVLKKIGLDRVNAVEATP